MRILAAGGARRRTSAGRRQEGRSLESRGTTVNFDAGVWSRRWRRLLDRLLPPHCLACGEAGAELCCGCADELPWLRHACARCAIPLPAGSGEVCGRCLRRPPAYAGCRALFVYADPVDRWLGGLKFHHDLAAGRLLAGWLGEALRGLPAVDAIVPMPLHRRRLRARGYNQVRELLRGPLPAPLRLDLLTRRLDTRAQSGLDAGQRRRNLRQAFAAAPAVRGLRLLLVDDVITTGSTVAEASRCLLGAGAAEVRVLALARVPKGGR